ncbi:protein Z-dependent protease inhibitor [Danio rerio]|uniref:Protein Z-dependent protease inhibitor n=2 Tax=Danio rerio TaxID=7955 RepID=A0AC58HPB1_DANRE
MEFRLLLVFISACFLCSAEHEELRTPDISDLAFRNTDFAINLYRKISSLHDRNVVFSPLSVSTCFSALLLAAQGSTRTEILKGLNLEALDGGDSRRVPELFQQLHQNISLQMEQGTALFLDQHFHLQTNFSQQIQRFFNAEVLRVDFSKPAVCRSLINEFVSRKTGRKVLEMLESVEPLTQMMLLNTIFYKGDWERPFNPNNTEKSRFYVDKYNIVQVPMMMLEEKFSVVEDRDLRARVLRLPYRGGASMLILLPNADADYTAIEDEISAERLHGWIKNMRRMKMEVHLPRFRMDQSYHMHELLPQLGISSVFQDSADLTGLSRDAHLKVSQVLHKAVIEVYEQGTSAASSTSVGITAYSLPDTFIINRPFFFFLYHEETASLLFMGRVIDPTLS